MPKKRQVTSQIWDWILELANSGEEFLVTANCWSAEKQARGIWAMNFCLHVSLFPEKKKKNGEKKKKKRIKNTCKPSVR